jgi:hypothetical protein
MKASLRSRLERLEAMTEVRTRPFFRYGWLKRLTSDYIGERHTVIVKRESTRSPHAEWCESEERPGCAPAADSDNAFTMNLTPEESSS